VTEAFRLADRIAVVADGGVRQVGTPGEISDAPADALVRGLIEGAA